MRPRRAPDAGRRLAPHPRHPDRRRAGRPRTEAVARVREEACRRRKAPKRSTRRSCGWLRDGRGGTPWKVVDRRAPCGRADRARRERYFAAEANRDPKPSCAGAWRRSARVSDGSRRNGAECSSSRPKARSCERASTAAGLCDRRCRPDPPLHAGPLAEGDRARHGAQFLRFLACWQHADGEIGSRAARRGRGRLAACRVRGGPRGVGGERAARPVRGYKREWLDQITCRAR